MKTLYWILCALLNIGSAWCLVAGLTPGVSGKNFMIIVVGALIVMLPFAGMLAWAILMEHYIGLAGLAVPAALILLAIFEMAR